MVHLLPVQCEEECATGTFLVAGQVVAPGLAVGLIVWMKWLGKTNGVFYWCRSGDTTNVPCHVPLGNRVTRWCLSFIGQGKMFIIQPTKYGKLGGGGGA